MARKIKYQEGYDDGWGKALEEMGEIVDKEAKRTYAICQGRHKEGINMLSTAIQNRIKELMK